MKMTSDLMVAKAIARIRDRPDILSMAFDRKVNVEVRHEVVSADDLFNVTLDKTTYHFRFWTGGFPFEPSEIDDIAERIRTYITNIIAGIRNPT